MSLNLFYNTISPLLKSILQELMTAKEFKDFRLVGGTALSLQIGHRESVDIDLFSDNDYDSIDFNIINTYLQNHFSYVDTNSINIIGFGKSYFIGNSPLDAVKLDLFYTDTFINPIKEIDNIKLADIEEIIAMKIDVIMRIGRKKDFWDIHELIESYTLEDMINLHKKRYPHTHSCKEILIHIINFNKADSDPDPICLRGKFWELIKLDIIDWSTNSREKL